MIFFFVFPLFFFSSKQADVEKQREAALAKLETPLEKMKIKDLKQLLQVLLNESCHTCVDESCRIFE